MIEYLPDEGKIIVSDRPGRSLWGTEHAIVTIFLESITGIGIVENEGMWLVSIVLRKGEPILIHSSTRSDPRAAREMASDLAAMISVPLRAQKNNETG